MLLIRCPVCDIVADETEFASGGLQSAAEQTGVPKFPRDVVAEWWCCDRGCGSWFGLARHLSNQRIAAVWRGHEPQQALSGDNE
jgi:sarcosine oxidase delta subunit